MSSPAHSVDEKVIGSNSSQEDAVVIGGKHPFYRGTFWQALIVGFCALLAPGIFNAMQSAGAGGAQSPWLVNAANAVLYGLLTVICFFGTVIVNKIGLRYALSIGTAGYCVYAAGLYANNRYGTVWLIILGAALCGLSAGLFWIAEGALMIGIPEEHKRGRYLSMWLAFRNSGSIIGGSINLGFNVSGKKTGKLDWRTYVVFVVLQAIAPFVALLLSDPNKVIRDDGTRVEFAFTGTVKEELREYWKVIKRPTTLLILPLFLYACWEISYLGTFLTVGYTVRARALASLCSALLQILGNLVFGSFLDWRRFTLNQRARYAYIGMSTLILAVWIWGTVVQVDYSGRKKYPTFDWVSPGFASGWVFYLFAQLNFALIYNYCYWIVGAMAHDLTELPRYTAVVRGVEAFGQVMAYVVNTRKTFPLTGSLGINFALWGVAVIPAYIAIRQVGIKAT